MRVGYNPNTNAVLPPQPGIIAAVITHLPSRKGYHAERGEAITKSLRSLRATCDLPLYIWDNGSDEDFRNWLIQEVKPDYLTLSPNIGKASARTAILRTFPLETVICISDDDILFREGWLGASLELLQGFPNVGVVSACPIRSMNRWGVDATLDWARKNAKLSVGRYIPDEWEIDYCVSIGRDFVRHMEDTSQDRDYLIEYNGMKAYAMAHHMQFIGYAKSLSKIGLWANQAMRLEQSFDVAIDRLGLLRLTTTERYCTHLGNVLDLEV